MPNLSVPVSAFFETALRQAAAAGKTSIESVVNAAIGDYFREARHRIYQVSTANALGEGVYEGAVSSETLLSHGDFGLGTFEHLDGEMVVLEGSIYQVHGDGSVERREDDFQVPFAVVSRFVEDEAFEVTEITSLKDLERASDWYRESDNLFYALRVDGFFKQIHTRAMRATKDGTRLTDAAKHEPRFHFNDIEGTLVCIWSPHYSRSFNVPGYHFHFISKDRTKGGHVLDCSAETLRVGMQILCEYHVRLMQEGSFPKANLTGDPTPNLAQSE